MSAKAAEDFVASVNVMQANVELFQRGVRDVYRVLATELRKLLCDQNQKQDISLLPRVLGDLRLHKFHWTSVVEQHPSLADGVQLLPGQLTVKNGTPHFELLFVGADHRMPLDAWLAQPYLSSDMTVRQFIRSVANKQGAHADPNYNDTLTHARLVRYWNEESQLHCTVGLAEYLLDFLRSEPLAPVVDVPLRRNADGKWECV